MGIRIAAAGVMVALAAAVMMPADPAEAQYRTRYQEWQSESKQPRHGYEGFPLPGIYCSYRREPIRVCNRDKRGRERCRVTSWRLVQWCS